jgi:hypothetical protein
MSTATSRHRHQTTQRQRHDDTTTRRHDDTTAPYTTTQRHQIEATRPPYRSKNATHHPTMTPLHQRKGATNNDTTGAAVMIPVIFYDLIFGFWCASFSLATTTGEWKRCVVEGWIFCCERNAIVVEMISQATDCWLQVL